MATYSKKGENPTEATLSAIQDTPDIRESDIKPIRNAGPAATGSAMEVPNEARRSGAHSAAGEISAETPAIDPDRDDRDVVQAANDDRASIGQIMQSLQRRPARTPFVIASLSTALAHSSAKFPAKPAGLRLQSA
jgi:hypothetical protein